jgi:hypothetical protein
MEREEKCVEMMKMLGHEVGDWEWTTSNFVRSKVGTV